MMVNPVSSVRFCANEAVTPANNVLERPGAFSKPATEKTPEANPAAPKKSSTTKKVLIGAGIVLAVAAALVAGKKTDVLKVLTEAERGEASFMKKVGHYLGVAGEWIGKYTYDPIAKLFSKKTPTA